MAKPLKLVCLGGSEELPQFLQQQAKFFGGAEIQAGQVAGTRVVRFAGVASLEDEAQEFTFFAIENNPDFQGVYDLLLSNADGLLGLVPASSVRAVETLRVIGAIQKALQKRQQVGEELPLALQYHWSAGATQPTPEEMDVALGVNPQAVTRVLSSADGSGLVDGIFALLKACRSASTEDSQLTT